VREDEDNASAPTTTKASVPIARLLQSISDTKSARFLPVGNHTEIIDPGSDVYRKSIGAVIRAVAAIEDCDLVIIDCRGGIDADSLAVCKEVDAILLVAETDAAAIRASENLVNFLTTHLKSGRHGKLVGFMINKAFADPTQIATANTSYFKTQYLGSVPFDFSTTRRFIFGELPTRASVFTIHVQAIAEKLFPSLRFPSTYQTWSTADYGKLSMRDPDSVVGGRACAAVILLVLYVNLSSWIFPSERIFLFDVPYYIRDWIYPIIDIIAAIAGITGSLYDYRRAVGKAVRMALRWLGNRGKKSKESNSWN
jgi:flagellar biosynthesis protein FlhG